MSVLIKRYPAIKDLPTQVAVEQLERLVLELDKRLAVLEKKP